MKTLCGVVLAGSLLAMLAGTAGYAGEEDAKLVLQTERVVLENAKVRVLEYRSKPTGALCGVGSHSHPEHVTVVLAAARDRATRSDGKVEEGDMQPGDVYWSDGETHADVNIGTTPSHLIVIEIKERATPRRSPR